MNITVRLFAILRDRAGVDRLTIDLPPGATVRDAGESVAATHLSLQDLLPRVAFAVNCEYVKPGAILRDGDELALIPPVSGG